MLAATLCHLSPTTQTPAAPSASPCVAASAPAQHPRLIYYNDAHHFAAKRIDPPATLQKLRRPVDELAGTGADTLVFGLGYSDVYFHQSKVGRVVGQGKTSWENFIDWRIMRMVQSAHEDLGTDQLRVVIERGRQMGVRVVPSLKVQDNSRPGSERCGLLKTQLQAAVCIGGAGRAEFCYDYAIDTVRESKLELAREILFDYRAEGLELDFMFDGFYFKEDFAKTVEAAQIMTAFVCDIKQLAREAGVRQQRPCPIVMVRINLEESKNLHMGLDVESWLREGSVDYIVGQDDAALVDTGIQAPWLPSIASAAGAAAPYYRPPRRIYDHRIGEPSVDMSRALVTTLRRQGYAGLYTGYLPWPFGKQQNDLLREAAFPEAFEREPKRYLLQPRELGPNSADANSPAPGPAVTGSRTAWGGEPARGAWRRRQLPAVLKEGATLELSIFVADELVAAQAEGALRPALLTVRFAFFCVEDTVGVAFNGEPLQLSEATESSEERALRIATIMPSGIPADGIDAPWGMSAHFYTWALPVGLLEEGWNQLAVTLLERCPSAGFERSVNGLEVLT